MEIGANNISFDFKESELLISFAKKIKIKELFSMPVIIYFIRFVPKSVVEDRRKLLKEELDKIKKQLSIDIYNKIDEIGDKLLSLDI